MIGKHGKQRKIRKLKKRLASGEIRFYYYAYLGGPKFWESPDEVDYSNPPIGFHEARNKLLEAEKTRPPATTIADLVDRLQHQDAQYKKLAKSSREIYAVYFKEVIAEFGGARISLFENRTIRAQVIAWRDKYAETPRAADYRVAALSRVIAYAVDLGFLNDNPLTGIANLYHTDRAGIIWTEDDIKQWLDGDTERGIAPARPYEIDIMMNARFSGLRRGDLASITRTADKGDHLQWFASKGRHGQRIEVIIPIVPEYRAYLDTLYRRQAEREITCLNLITNRLGKPYTASGLGRTFGDRSHALGIDKHLHDLRGSYATELMRAGFDDREIAEVTGWTSSNIRAIRRKYIDRKAIISAGVSRLHAERSRNRN